MPARLSDAQAALWLWSWLLLLLSAQFYWCQFYAYPVSFERKLRRGKSWVYIPMHWRGFRKFQILLLSRILMGGVAFVAAALLAHHLGHGGNGWLTLFGAGSLLLAWRLDWLWTYLRYRQQEDAYYLLHDELRAKLEQEGKDLTEAQFRNLAIYQHQQRLRKADETGMLIVITRQEAKRSRSSAVREEPVLESR